jgi:hypothetical protein
MEISYREISMRRRPDSFKEIRCQDEESSFSSQTIAL